MIRIHILDEAGEIARDLLGDCADFLVISDDEPDLHIGVTGTGESCGGSTLLIDGRISCAAALDMADRLEIPVPELGWLIRALRIKIRNCSLGCF